MYKIPAHKYKEYLKYPLKLHLSVVRQKISTPQLKTPWVANTYKTSDETALSSQIFKRRSVTELGRPPVEQFHC